MLIYHPAFDAYHCVYRLILITQEIQELEYSKLRILDFYLCFPAEVARIELPQAHQRIRAIARQTANKFRGPVSPLRTFHDLEQIQSSATRLLVASDVFEPKKLEQGIISRTNRAIPADFHHATPADTGPTAELTKYILTQLSSLPLAGTGGLKQRSGLMEYRYDPI